MTAQVHLSIRYDGPALAQHTMDVRELAPALVAVAQAIEESNRLLFPGGPEVRVQVRGGFRSGSFGIDLTALQPLSEQLVELFAGKSATAAANLLAIVSALGLAGGAARGLVMLILRLRGRRARLAPESPQTQSGDSPLLIVEALEDERVVETIQVEHGAWRLYQSHIVRRALYGAVRPLEQEGIDAVVFSGHEGHKTEVRQENVPWFAHAAEMSEIISEARIGRALLQIESAVFVEGNKWRFTDGSTKFHAELSDPQFLARIEAGEERFGKGDLLVVDLLRIQSMGPQGLRTDHVIERVHEHRAPPQRRLV